MFIFLLLFLFPAYADAYLDLGSGSYFLQMFLALLFTVLVSVRAFWYKIFSFFKRGKKDEKEKDKDKDKDTQDKKSDGKDK